MEEFDRLLYYPLTYAVKKNYVQNYIPYFNLTKICRPPSCPAIEYWQHLLWKLFVQAIKA